ncbi:hypothetical protein FQN54_003968 [Arachnomyces sp. PD_36]|nr:hypothetical protein FQN54_003968 [Arachnomyces sp. PD_36]
MDTGDTKYPNRDRWPVYMMKYRCAGVEKQLRIEWHAEPGNPKKSEGPGKRVEDAIQCIRDYIKDPKDVANNPDGTTFKGLLPDCCVVLKDGHKTLTSKTERPPDEDYHITVRFGKLADRTRPRGGWGHTVHIYLDEATKKYIPRAVSWEPPSVDKERILAVYRNRNKWPAGADATKAPPAPGVQGATSASTTEGLVLAPQPTIPAWGSGNPPPQPNLQQSGRGRGQGPSGGVPPSGRGRGG